MLENIFPRKKKKILEEQLQNQLVQFSTILSFANNIINSSINTPENYKKYYTQGNKHPIIDVIKLIGRNAQTKYLTSLLYHEDETNLDSIFAGSLFFDQQEFITTDYRRMEDFFINVENTKKLYLNNDLVLPWPWKRSRLISTVTNIGAERRWGEWKEDKMNHRVDLWLPMGIGWVYSGNHSIATGILQGSGIITPKNTYDISPVFNQVYTDGLYYYRKEDDNIISPVFDLEFAAIFEIGRLMTSYNITF